MTLIQFMEHIKTPAIALRFFQRMRWKDGVVCQKCGVIGSYRLHNRTKLGFQKYHCRDCRHIFSDTSGTFLHRKRITAQQLMITVFELTDNKSITSVKLGKRLGIKQRKAWNILHIVRQHFHKLIQQMNIQGMRGVVESDEAYLGRGNNSTMVQGIVQRGKTAVIIPILNRTEETLKGNIEKRVKKHSYIMTDTAAAYGSLSCHGYSHFTLNHSKEEFSKGNGIHSNTIEGLWGNLKKVLYGIHHGVAKKNLFGYVSEYLLKYNTRDKSNFFTKLLTMIFKPTFLPLTC